MCLDVEQNHRTEELTKHRRTLFDARHLSGGFANLTEVTTRGDNSGTETLKVLSTTHIVHSVTQYLGVKHLLLTHTQCTTKWCLNHLSGG